MDMNNSLDNEYISEYDLDLINGIEELKQYIHRECKRPYQNSTDEYEKKLGEFLIECIQSKIDANYNQIFVIKSRKDVIDNFFNDEIVSKYVKINIEEEIRFPSMINGLIIFIRSKNRLPKNSTDIEERILFRFLRDSIKNYKKSKISNLQGNKWINTMNKRIYMFECLLNDEYISKYIKIDP